jgi:hypothetical protein
MLNLLRNSINAIRSISGLDSDASAFITATGLSGTTQKSAITTLVKDLKSSGLWSKMKAVYPMVTDNYNLLSYTQDFGTSWTPFTSASVLTNTTTAPDGTLTADTLTFSSNLLSLIYQPYTSTSKTFTISIYAKSSTGKKFCFRNTDGVAEARSADFTTTNQWQRFSYTFTIGLTNVGICNELAGTIGSIDIWGAQLEISSTASAYQPILTTPSAFMASQMKYNLKDARDLDAAFRLTFSGGWTYSTNGAQPNGTNGYADTKLNDSILTPNSSHLSFYSRTNVFQGAYDIGLFNATNGIWLGVGYTNGIRTGIFQTGASGELNLVTANTLGFVVATKNGSTTNTAYKNGVNLISGVKPDTSATNTTVYLGALNQNGTPGYGFSTKQIGFATIGNGLSDAEVAILYQLIQQYQTDLSRQV